MKKKYIYFMVSTLGLLLIDQVTKAFISGTNESICIINGLLQFNYVQNTGGAFSIGQNNLLEIIITNVIILGILIHFIIAQIDRMNPQTKFCSSLILAGGISNLLDRIIRGYVVDFIDVTPWINFPIFNIADMYIVIGWLLFVILTIQYAGRKKHINTHEEKNEH